MRTWQRVLLLLVAPAVLAATAEALPRAAVSENAGMVFEANRGQTDPAVRFLARGNGYALFLTSDEMVLRLARPDEAAAVVRMRLSGARPRPEVVGLDELPGKVNYFIGDDPARWRTNVPTYARVRYRGVYPGVDLVYYGNQRRLEYDFLVAPGADPGAVRLAFEGPEAMRIDAQGDLVLQTAGGEVRLQKPVVYQEIDGTRRPIAARYTLVTPTQVGFQVAAYDTSKPLVIDPVLLYATYLGGVKVDRAFGVAADGAGHAYVTGDTLSADFPRSATAYQGSLAKSTTTDCFITRLNTTASGAAQLVYSTYLGGSSHDQCFAIALDGGGNAYVTGQTFSSNFPAKALSTSNRGTSDGFVVKLNPAGSALVYSVFVGGSADDAGYGIAVAPNASGQIEAYVTGKTTSTNFPVTSTRFQGALGDPAKTALGDAFVAKLNAGGTALLYSTYLGGSGADQGAGIAVDGAGHAYVTGTTASGNFPATLGALGGTSDAFVAKLNTLASGPASLVYSTHLGGACADQGQAIALDASGSAYVTGQTFSSDFPGAATLGFQPGLGEPASGCGATGDAFVAKLDAAGASLLYSTYLGGNAADQGTGIAADGSGNAYVTGVTASTSLPTTANALYLANQGGAADAFVARIDTATPGPASLAYLTYLGGTGDDQARALAVDAARKVYVAGQTSSSGLFAIGALTPGFQPALGGATDAFVAVLDAFAPPPPTITSGPANPTKVRDATFTFTPGAGSEPGVTFVCRLDGGVFSPCVSGQSYSGVGDGPHTFQVKARDAAGNESAAASYTWTVDATPPVIGALGDITVEATSLAGATVTYTATVTDTGGSASVTCAPASGSTFPLGTTLVTCTATDTAGNTSMATFNVLVQDTTPPAVGAVANMTVEATSAAGAVVTYATPAATDAVTSPLAVSCALASGNTFPLGTTTVTCSATDAAGNTGSSTFTVMVQDTTPPVLGAVSDITAEATSPAGAVVTYASPAANDAVTASPPVVCAPASGSTFPIATTPVVCTATDAAGNFSTVAFNVTVQDTTRPVSTITFPVSDFYGVSKWNAGCGTAGGDICGTATDSGAGIQKVEVSLRNNTTGKYWNGGAFASNTEESLQATGTTAWSLTFDPAKFPADGSYTVHARATDNVGNAEASPTATFTIDTTPPVLGAVSNVMYQTSAPNPAYSTPTATDNIDSSPTVSCTPAPSDSFPLGDTEVTCTATDDALNSSQTSFTVTVTTEPVPNLALISVPATSVRQGDPIVLTADITYAQTTTTITPDCINTAWTIRRADGSTVEPRFRERMYGIPNDLTTLAAGAPFRVSCDVSEVIDPSLLPPGLYKVFATYSNYIQDNDPTPPVFNVWTGSINSSEADLTVAGTTLRVAVDVKPNGFPNAWNCGSTSGLPVAVLSSPGFDPSSIDAASVRFGKTGGPSESSDPTPAVSDVNGDGVPDLIFHFPFGATGFSCADIPTGQQDTTVVGLLQGQTTSGAPISGSDSIRLVTGANVK